MRLSQFSRLRHALVWSLFDLLVPSFQAVYGWPRFGVP